MSPSKIFVLLCAAAVCSGTASADVVQAVPITGQSVPNIAADAETQAGFADGFVVVEDNHVMISLVRDGLGDVTFTLPDGSSWAMVVLLMSDPNPEFGSRQLRDSTPVQFASIDDCHVSLSTILESMHAGDNQVGAEVAEFGGEVGVAVPLPIDAADFWTTDDIAMVVSGSGYGHCWEIADGVKVCYLFGIRDDGSWCLIVRVFYKDENEDWVRVFELNTGWVEPATANSAVLDEPVRSPLEAFNLAMQMMESDLLGRQPAARDLWDDVEAQLRAQFVALVESGTIPWPDPEE